MKDHNTYIKPSFDVWNSIKELNSNAIAKPCIFITFFVTHYKDTHSKRNKYVVILIGRAQHIRSHEKKYLNFYGNSEKLGTGLNIKYHSYNNKMLVDRLILVDYC